MSQFFSFDPVRKTASGQGTTKYLKSSLAFSTANNSSILSAKIERNSRDLERRKNGAILNLQSAYRAFIHRREFLKLLSIQIGILSQKPVLSRPDIQLLAFFVVFMQRTCRESDLDKQYTQYLEISVVQFKLLIELKASLEILETSLLCRKACFLGIEFYLPRLDLHEIEYTITFLLLLKEILLNPQILKLDTDFVYRIITSEHFLSFYSDATFSDRMTFKDLMKSIFSLVLTSTPFNSSFFLAALVFFQQNSPEKELNLLFEDITLDISLFLGVFEVLNCNSNLKIMFPFDIMLRSYSLCKVDRINLTCEDMKKILKFMRNIRREFSIDSNDHTSNSSYKSLAISLLIQLKKVVLTAELILSNIAIFCEIYYYVHLSFPTSSFDFTLAFLYQGDAAGLPILLFCLEDTHFMEESSIYIDWFLCNIFSNNMTNVSDEEFHSFPDSGYERKFLKFIDLSLRAYFRLLFDQSILENPPFFREYIIAGKAKFFEKIYVRNLRLSFLERLFWSHSLESYCESVKIYVPDEISNFENYFYDLIFEQSADATSGNGSTKTGSGSVLEGKDFLFIASLLKYIPFTLPLHFRFELFRRLWERHNSKVGFGRSLYDYLAGPDSMTLNIRRGHEYEDAFQVFLDNKSFYQSKDFRIVFTDELGMREAGMDGGGLFREFLFEIFRTVFSPVFGLFITMEDASESWYPNPNSFLTTGVSLAYYEFLGTLVGCAIFVKALLPINFADTFIKRIYNISPQFDELKSFDPQLYKNLLMLKKYTSDISELGLNFSIVDEGVSGPFTRNLISGGDRIAVTNKNRFLYIYHVIHHRLKRQIESQCNAFMTGLFTMMPKQLLSLFAFDEFQVIISGTQLEIDVTDWHLNTVYHGSFNEEHKTVAYFWNFLRACSPYERAAILAFSTGYSRAPLFGFSSLTPKFCLCLDVQGSDDHLPTASTCANLLKIPAYSSYEVLSSKCRYIISEKPGFHLQ